MKYIRTKDGRIGKVISVRDYNGGKPTFYHVQFKNDKEIYNDYELNIISQADTIEELCDEFVDTSELKTTTTGGWLYDEFDSKNKCLVYYAEDERRTIPLNEFEDLSKTYGAIWTDKGLIYVAKMNDKGELELL